MLIKRTAMWLLALGVSIALGPLADGQVPSNSNLDYQTPNPTYENGSASFAESAPRSHKWINPFHPVGFEPSWGLVWSGRNQQLRQRSACEDRIFRQLRAAVLVVRQTDRSRDRQSDGAIALVPFGFD